MAGTNANARRESQDSKSYVIARGGEIVLPDDAFQSFRDHLLNFSLQVNPGKKRNMSGSGF